MQCVTCEAELQQVSREAVQLDECPQGHGVWLDGNELRQVVERVEQPRDAVEKEQAISSGVPAALPDVDAHDLRQCPVCEREMAKVNYDETSGIMIDRCPEHGAWVDAGELVRIEAWVEAHRDEYREIRQFIDAQAKENSREVDEAYAAGERWGPLGMLASMVHYARHAD